MTDTKTKLIELLSDFDNAMLVTHGSEGSLDGRPMAIASVEDNGDLWFISDRQSGKVAEIRQQSRVAVMMQQSNKFVSLQGECELVNDTQRIAELWREPWKVWFPEGKDDPSIVLLKVVAKEGEYWDNSGLDGLNYLIKAGLAYIRGERASTDESINAEVKLQS